MPITIAALTSVNEDNAEDLVAYLATTTPLLNKAGAKIVSSYPVSETVVGDTTPAIMTIVEYPNREAVSTVFDSAEYGLLSEIRRRAFSTYEIFIVDGLTADQHTARA